MSCQEVQIEVTEYTVSGLGVGLAFFVAFLCGAGIAAAIVYFCIRDMQGKRDPEKLGSKDEDSEAVGIVSVSVARPTTSMSTKGVRKRLQSAKKKKGSDTEPLVEITIASVVEVQIVGVDSDTQTDETDDSKLKQPGTKGVIDALEKKTASAMELELASQDIEAIDSLERELKAESIMTGIQILRSLLGQQLNKGALKEEEYKQIMQNAQDNISEIMKTNEEEQQAEEREVEKKFKDPAQREAAKEDIHSKYAAKLNSQLADERETMRKDLRRHTNLSEEDIEAILAQYSGQMASLEKKMALERARQTANLEERLAKRKYLAGSHQQDLQQQAGEIDHRKQTNELLLTQMVQEKQLNDKQKEDLLKQYDADLARVQTQNQLEFEKQRDSLAAKIKKARGDRTRKLLKEQEKQRQEFVKTSEQAKVKDVVNEYHNLLAQQRQERDQLSDELDDQEANNVAVLLQEQDKKRKQELDRKEEEFQEKLKKSVHLPENEMNRLLAIHDQEMHEYERIKRADKKKMDIALREKLEERKRKAAEQLVQTEEELAAVNEQQEQTVKKVMDSQKELSSEDRETIMNEHKHNMAAVQNQLQMSKLRQQKLLEQKLAGRRGRLEELQKKREDLSRNKRLYKEAERKKLEDQLAKQIAEEEATLEKYRKDEINSLRQRMARETEQALAEQDKRMGAIIARLQVGQARRQTILMRQDKKLKELENKLAEQVDNPAGSPTPADAEVEYLLKQHQRGVSELSEQLDDARRRQEMALRDKLEAKKAAKTREVEHSTARRSEDLRRPGALISTAILQNVMLEQRHKMEIRQLEKEMELEMQKQREQLNEQLERELQEELQNQKKTFLAQIAAIKGMSKSEINQLVDSAVLDAGGNEKEAKKLRKEFNSDVQRAKSELGVESRTMGTQRRGRTMVDDNEEYYEEPASGVRSGKARQPRAALRKRDDSDEDF